MGNFQDEVRRRLREVLPLGDLPRLLWWAGTVSREALNRIAILGQSVRDTADHADRERLLEWVRAVEVALYMALEKKAEFGPAPVWAFWTLFSRTGEPETPLSTLLREEIGYPTDEEAGITAEVPLRAPLQRAERPAAGMVDGAGGKQ